MGKSAITPFATKFAEEFLRGILKDAISTGRIDPSKLTPEQIRAEGIDILKRYSKGEIEFRMITDHTSDLLSRARIEVREDNHQLAIFFYATWAEHSLNRWICYRCGGSDNQISKMLIRETAIRAKYAWVYMAFTNRKPPELQINRLQKLSDARNQYVHYKWQPSDFDSSPTKEHLARVHEAELLIASMRKFENTHFFKNSRKKLFKPRK